MSDAIDAAQDWEMLHRHLALEDQLASRKAEAPRVIDGVHLCLDCNDPIDPRRLKALPTAVRCTECQQYHKE